MNLIFVIIICIAFLAIAFAGFAIKMFLKKNGEFKKQCSMKNPKTNESIGCSCGGNKKSCKNINSIN